MIIEWTDSLKLNIKIIDLQHQQLFKVTNQLLQKIDTPIPDAELDSYFQEVINYTHYHFDTEELYFQKFSYDPVATQIHIQEHQEFTKEVTRLYSQIKTNKLEATFKLVDILENWLLHHIPTIDRQYVDCFHQHGLK